MLFLSTLQLNRDCILVAAFRKVSSGQNRVWPEVPTRSGPFLSTDWDRVVAAFGKVSLYARVWTESPTRSDLLLSLD